MALVRLDGAAAAGYPAVFHLVGGGTAEVKAGERVAQPRGLCVQSADGLSDTRGLEFGDVDGTPFR